jgi:hypothetical protein
LYGVNVFLMWWIFAIWWSKNIFLVNFLHCSKLGCKLGLCVLNCPIFQLSQGFEYSRKSLIPFYDGQFRHGISTTNFSFPLDTKCIFLLCPFCTLSILKFNAISCNTIDHKTKFFEDDGFTISSNFMIMNELEYRNMLKQQRTKINIWWYHV